MPLPSGREAGVGLHITSLPGPYGIGEIGREAFRFIDTIRAMGMRAWQILPVCASGNDPSPYQPVSAFAGNTLLLDVERLVDDGLLTSTETVPLKNLPQGRTDFASLRPLKRRLLKCASERFLDRASQSERASLDEFVYQHDAQWLHDYALFRVLKAHQQERQWPDWEPALVRRKRRELRSFERSARREILNVKVRQYLFFSQWNKLRNYASEQGVSLVGDMPIYVPLDCADAWRLPDILSIDRDGCADHVAGVPPDYFSRDGQRWGNPLYNWDYHRETGYRWWIERMRHTLALADIVRLDHFRGFESYWSIPATAPTARDGEWLKGPGDALFNVLRKELGDLPIIAEDLGIITDAVTALRERHKLPGMQVLQFLIEDEQFDPAQIPWNSVCYTGTHDNDTTRGWFDNGTRLAADDEGRRQATILRATGGRAETIHHDLMQMALGSAARLCIIPAQDLLGLGSAARMNTPGTETGNWQWRLQDVGIPAVVSDAIHAMIEATDRST